MATIAGCVWAVAAAGQDTTPPNPFDLVSPANGGWCSATCGFTWQPAADNVGVAKYVLFINGMVKKDNLPPSSGDYTLTTLEALTEGPPYSWFVRACDAAANCRDSTNTRSFFVDATPPTSFNLTAPADQAWGSLLQDVAFGWSPSSDNGSGLASYELLIDGQVRATVPANTVSILASHIPGAYSYLAPGAHTWTVMAIDLAGNSRTTTTRTIRMDSEPPQFGSGQVTVDAYRNSTAAAPLTTDVILPAGSQVTITATASWCIYNCGNPQSFYGADGRPGESVRTNGCPVGILVGRFAGGPWMCLGSYSVITSAGGPLILALNDTNYADNAGSAQVNIGPIVGGLPLPNTWIADRTPTFSWTLAADAGGSGVATQALAVDGTARVYSGLAPTTTTFMIPAADALTDGWHDWHLVAVDAAGNQGLTALQRFGVDTTGPVGLRLSTTNGTADGAIISNPTPNLCWTVPSDAGSGLAGYRLYIDAGLSRDSIPAPSHCSTPATPLGEGRHTWSAAAFDALGNTTASLETWTLTYDISSPTVFGRLTPIDGATVTEPRPTFSWQPSSDLGTGIDHYEVWIDSGAGGQCAPCSVPPDRTSLVPALDLSTGLHTWFVKAVDGAGHTTQTDIGNFGVVATPTATATLTSTATATATVTATATRTDTATPTRMPTATAIATLTATVTGTATASATLTATAMPTATKTASFTSTPIATPTVTATASATGTMTPTPSPTRPATPSDSPTATPTPPPCGGDCDGSGQVTIDELVLVVNIALGNTPLSRCAPGDLNGDARVTIDEVVRAVDAALQGCHR